MKKIAFKVLLFIVVIAMAVFVSCSNSSDQDLDSQTSTTTESGNTDSGESTDNKNTEEISDGNTPNGTAENNVTGYQFHETVEYLPAGTDGTAGTTGTYVLFGDWPQTIKASDVEIDTTKTMTKGTFTFYLGSDSNWYIIGREKAYEEGYTYSDGTTVQKLSAQSDKYFKVEPIKWRILNPNSADGTKKFLLAERCLIAGQIFDPGNSRSLNNQTIYGNNYRYSNMRAYLNGTVNEYVSIKCGENIPTYELVYKNMGFLYSAFTVSAINIIADTLVKNDLESTNDISNTYICEDTSDKIFLPSRQEMNNTEYGFSEDNTRIREATDYAKARGMKLSEDGGWLLRSPARSSSKIYRVCSNGSINAYTDVAYELGVGSKYAYAIVPALCLNE